MRLKTLLFALLFAAIIGSSALAGTWMIKQDVLQPFSVEKCGFETVLVGTNSTNNLTGGNSSVSNAFPTPRWNLDDNGNSTRITWTGNLEIAAAATQRHSFGVSGTNQFMPKIQDLYWVGCAGAELEHDIVPGVSIDSISSPYTGTAYVTISNTTNESIYVNEIAYLSKRFAELSDLNHDIIPRSSFSSVDLPPDMQLYPGQSFNFPVYNSRRTDFIIMKFDVEYAVSSALGNLYQGTTEEWFAFREVDENPSTLYSFDTDENLYIDDHEFFKAVDAWIRDEVNDSLFFEVVDVWVAQAVIARRSVRSSTLPDRASIELSESPGGITFSAFDKNIESMHVQVFALSGAEIYSESAIGSHLAWNLNTRDGKALANGIYLYVVKVRDAAGNVTQSNLKRLLILR